MKRVGIVCVLFVLIVGLCIFCTWQVQNTCNATRQYVQEIQSALEAGNETQMRSRINALHTYWDRQAFTLSPFVRHSILEETSRSVAQLRALAHEHGQAELRAQLEIINWQMQHLWESEIPVWHNIL